MSAVVPPRIAGNGYGLPLRPEVLAKLDAVELDSVLIDLGLDPEQAECAHQAVARIVTGSYASAVRREGAGR